MIAALTVTGAAYLYAVLTVLAAVVLYMVEVHR